MTTKSTSAAPALALPRLSEKLADLGADLARCALEFGIEGNRNFPARLATIAFANAILLAARNPQGAAELASLLVQDGVPGSAGAPGEPPVLAADVLDDSNWTREILLFLSRQWEASADAPTQSDSADLLTLRTLQGLHTGLVVAREQPGTAAKIEQLLGSLGQENQFLSLRVLAWSGSSWRPVLAPFLEFTRAHYPEESVELRVIGETIAPFYATARRLNDPWDFSYWAQVGWNAGLHFARMRPQDTEALLKEAGPEGLQSCLRLFTAHVLGTTKEGVVQIDRACLRFFGEANVADLARCYCTGREARRVARTTYDFCFWMGVFAAFPLPATNDEEGSR
ncbi:MAG: hypothetical protein RIQ93_1782 [Verrucomicrobiota bacterium]|jgi:hypothetical protein